MKNSMEICAGTSQGVFVVSEGAAKQVLRSRDVRELVRIGGRCFAGTGDGLYVSDDCGRTWVPSGLEGREVWQVRDNGNGLLYAGTEPTGLFRSEDNGDANFHGLTVDPEVPGGVLVGTDTGEVWRVSDCAEWELCGEGMPTVLSLAAMA